MAKSVSVPGAAGRHEKNSMVSGQNKHLLHSSSVSERASECVCACVRAYLFVWFVAPGWL